MSQKRTTLSPVLRSADANQFVDQGLADEDELTLPSDLAVAADAADLVIGIVTKGLRREVA